MDDSNQPQDERYLGLTAAQFNLAFFAAVGAIAIAVGLYFGGAGAAKDLLSGGEEPPHRAAVVRTVTPTATAPIPTTTSAPEETGKTVGSLLGTFNPSALLGVLGSAAPAPGSTPSQQQGSLEAALLEQGDLPPGFQPFGEMSFSIPTEFGTADMAANMFASGDLVSGDFGSMVMSAVIAAPPEAVGQLGDLSQMEGLSQEELDEIAAGVEQFGITFSNFRLLDASGLGEGGVGVHMEMDFGALFGELELPAADAPFDAIAWDMYMFVRGERMLMVMVMWPAERPSGVDGRVLAEAMDAKAATP